MPNETIGEFMAREYPQEETPAGGIDPEWLRDQFAMAALMGMLSSKEGADAAAAGAASRGITSGTFAAMIAYEQADAMLEARNKQRGVQHDSSNSDSAGG